MGQPGSAQIFDAILILCADHELNISAFTARCITSAGATPYGAILGALAALQGTRHGGSTELVAALFADMTIDPRSVVEQHLKRGVAIPGFGHPLYPRADPRTELLLALAADVPAAAPLLSYAQAIMEWVRQSLDQTPNLDFGLVVAAKALDLPPHAPLTLFALGRSAGWMGHIIEQAATETLIRPRARYVGRLPEA